MKDMKGLLPNLKGNMQLKGNVLNSFPTAIGLSAATLVLALVPSYAMADPTATPSPTPTPSPTAATTTESAGSQDRVITVTVSTPTAAHSPTTVTVTGLREGQWIDIDGYPDGWDDEAPYHKEVQQLGNGPVATQLDAPLKGWPDGKYRWIITLQNGTFIHRSFTFTRQPQVSTPTTKQPDDNKAAKSKDDETKAPREKTRAGGLAKTGV